jgi:proteasome accessory factor C
VTRPPLFVQSFAQIPEIVAHIRRFPDGLPLTELARRFDLPVDELRGQLLAFYAADIPSDQLFGLVRVSTLEFSNRAGEEADPHDAERVRVVDHRPFGDLGVDLLDTEEVALLVTAGLDLLDAQPSNEPLREAVQVLEQSLLGQRVAPHSHDDVVNGYVRELRRAAADRHRVRIVYSRAWNPGVHERTIEPYPPLRRTSRGWEVDAGPLDDEGRPRTFLVSRIRELEVLDEHFEPDPRAPSAIAASRQPRSMDVVIPQGLRWVVELQAEDVEVVQEDERMQRLRLSLLPPVAERVGLILLILGEDAWVMDADDLADAGRDTAARLLAHHREAPELFAVADA